MKISEIDINVALQTYLGAIESAGYLSLGCDERLKIKYKGRYTEVMEFIRPYLDVYYEANWENNRSLVQEVERIERLFQIDFPELSSITTKSLAYRWGYSWK